MSARRNPAVARDPTRVLFGIYHRSLLGLLLMRPEQSFHLREIGRLTGVPSGPAHRDLRKFESSGLLTAERVGNQVRYRANRAHPIFPELQGIIRKSFGMADVLREALVPLHVGIRCAFVFGSFARGEEGPTSDIDLMVIGDVKFDEVVAAIYPLHERLGREVNPLVLTAKEFRQRVKDRSFFARVLEGEKVMLMGTLDEP